MNKRQELSSTDKIDKHDLFMRINSNKIYSTHYGLRAINHICSNTSPPLSCGYEGNIKNFFFEIRPIILAAKRLNFSHFVYFGSNFPFDGILIDKPNKKIRHIECSQAVNGQITNLISEHLDKFNDAPVFNEPKTNNKSKASGYREIFYTPSEPTTDDKILCELISLICDRLQKKIKSNKYHFTNGILAITFDVYLPFCHNLLKEKLSESIKEHHININNSPFSTIILNDHQNFLYSHEVIVNH